MQILSTTEDGAHVRPDYTKAMFAELCSDASLVLDETSYCTEFLSQTRISS